MRTLHLPDQPGRPDAIDLVIAAQHDVATLGQLREAGLTRREIRFMLSRGAWVRGPGRTVILRTSKQVDLPCRAAAHAIMAGPGAVLSHTTAGQLHGWRGLDGLPGFSAADDRIHLTVPRSQPRRLPPSAASHRRDLHDAELAVVDGLTVTNPVATAADILLTQPRLVAVAAIDSALLGGSLTGADLAKVRESLERRHGAGLAREHLDQVDGRSESVLESLGRLVFTDLGLPPDDLQIELYAVGGVVWARLDFGWVRLKVACEADGLEYHDGPTAAHRDRDREARLRDEGWEIVRFTWWDLVHRPEEIVARVRAAMARQLARRVA